jgi:hypothetical protein
MYNNIRDEGMWNDDFLLNTPKERATLMIEVAAEIGISMRIEKAYDVNGNPLEKEGYVAIHIDGGHRDLTEFWKIFDSRKANS